MALAFNGKGGGGGGVTLTHTREEVSGPDHGIADGAAAALPFQHQGGDALLNYTDPLNPAVVVTGLYAITVEAVCISGAQASGWFQSILRVSAANSGEAESATSLVLGTFPNATLGLTVYLEAGDTLTLGVTNGSGLGGSLTFAVNIGVVQRVY